MMFGIVSASLSPNVERDDVGLAFRTLLSPRKWIVGGARIGVERWFARYLNTPHVLTFNSGRSALFAILRSFDIGSGDEVLLQAFTCVAVPNTVIWTQATPVYVDVDDSLNFDPADAAKKISKRTKAIIVQHTFGVPADMEKILALAKKHKLIVIEDCAHSLGAAYNDHAVGTIGDAACFSFGRDKVISSVFGGLASINKENGVVWKKLKRFHDTLPYPGGFWVFQQLLHPVAFFFILPMYRLGFGKIILILLQKFGLLGFPVYQKEKRGLRPSVFPAKYPNGLAILLVLQLKKLAKYNNTRQERATLYRGSLANSKGLSIPQARDKAIYMRFPVFVSGSTERVMRSAKQHGILLGNWYHNVIDPAGVKFEDIGYRKGSCPKAEHIASGIVNLPTNISEKQARRVMREFR